MRSSHPFTCPKCRAGIDYEGGDTVTCLCGVLWRVVRPSRFIFLVLRPMKKEHAAVIRPE